MNIIPAITVNNPYYKANVDKTSRYYSEFQKNGPRGLMLHSVGCPQPRAEVFVNTWNNSNARVAIHAVLQADGTVYQCLPWNYRGIHAGGKANNTHIGVEMTEPDCIKYTKGSSFICSDVEKAKAQAVGTYNTAVELFAQLCNEFNLDPMTDIISHNEGYAQGVASNHGDPVHLWKQLGLGYTMDTFRKAVKTAVDARKASFTVRVSITNLNIRKGPGWRKFAVVMVCPPGVYTISETKSADGFTWGRLKSGAGWIALEYATRL